ncbi:MAG: hypothetical protein ACKV2T_08490 [Kofleriaceae bacterium]
MTTATRAFLFATLATAACLEPDEELELAERSLAVQLPNYTIVTNTVTSTTNEAETGATCPEGMNVLGGSFAATDSTGAYIHTVVPSVSAPTVTSASWYVQTRNSAPRLRAWNLRVTAICASQPADYRIVTTATDHTTLSQKQHSIACPAGSVSTGGGFVLMDIDGNILPGEATYVMPSWDGTSWLVNAKSPTPTPWSLRLLAVCAAPWALPGYEVVTNESAYDATWSKELTTDCPKTKAMTGAGWGVVDSTNAILEGTSLTHEVGAAGQTWLTTATNQSGFSPEWRLQQRALCVD